MIFLWQYMVVIRYNENMVMMWFIILIWMTWILYKIRDFIIDIKIFVSDYLKNIESKWFCKNNSSYLPCFYIVLMYSLYVFSLYIFAYFYILFLITFVNFSCSSIFCLNCIYQYRVMWVNFTKNYRKNANNKRSRKMFQNF